MRKEDDQKTSFITSSDTYCYLQIPEGLKNAGGSFNRMTVGYGVEHTTRQKRHNICR
jgi:hypothetical protein